MNERASSDTGEAGFNSKARGGQPGSIWRLGKPRDPVQFHGCGAIGEGSRDLTAIHCLYSMPPGYRSRHRDTHEIMLLYYICVLGSRVWLQY